MGVIQQGINQLIGTAAIAARLSPGLETKRELKASEKIVENIKAQNKSIREVAEELPEEQIQKIQTELEKQFEIDPTPERYKKSQIIPNYKKEQAEIKEDEDRRLQAEAEAQLAEQERLKAEYEAEQKGKSIGQKRGEEKGLEQLKQKRNFSEYLKKLETSFGGTVGDLPKSMQQTIAKQYSSKQRKEIMDTMDKEVKK